MPSGAFHISTELGGVVTRANHRSRHFHKLIRKLWGPSSWRFHDLLNQITIIGTSHAEGEYLLVMWMWCSLKSRHTTTEMGGHACPKFVRVRDVRTCPCPRSCPCHNEKATFWIYLSRLKIIYAIEIYSTCTSIINSYWAIRILIMLNHKLSNQVPFISFAQVFYRGFAIRSWFSSYSKVFLEHVSINSGI